MKADSSADKQKNACEHYWAHSYLFLLQLLNPVRTDTSLVRVICAYRIYGGYGRHQTVNTEIESLYP